ncbi:astacin [Teladorsagia circumcincta]|uniref:Metalloendopeptidase n=1 Tax=Teladorsagia circumcincta TaxID=45464 RepID=A0A2G9UE44_TELCI|nr:astacin [Teladorsagia circumcincta]
MALVTIPLLIYSAAQQESGLIHCQSRMKMIVALLVLAVILDTSFCISEKGRIELTKAHKGMDLEKRRERLRNLGLIGSGLNSAGGNNPSTVNGAVTTKAVGGDVSLAFGDVASIEEVNRIAGIDEYLYDGDMILTDEQLSALERENENPTRAKRQISQYALRWTNNKVHYYFDPNITVVRRQYVRTVLKYLQQRTCLSFIENASAPKRIKVIAGSGCYSYVGMIGGEQELSLAGGCMNVGAVAHEFTHALGSVHTHMRDDRDTYVTVNLTYVAAHNQNNFVKYAKTINHVPYEYGSYMHYTGHSRGIRRPVLVLELLENARMQATQIRKIAKYAFARMATEPTGYGAYCAQRPAGCGTTLTAFKAWKSRSITLGNATITTTRDTVTTCSDWITAPAGKTIQFRITALTDVQCYNGCMYSSIEPRILIDKAMTSPRICCPEQLNQIVATKNNPAPIVAYSVEYVIWSTPENASEVSCCAEMWNLGYGISHSKRQGGGEASAAAFATQ